MEIINIDKDSEIVLDTQAKEIEININKCRVIISDISSCKKKIVVNDGELDYCYIKKNELDNEFNLTLNGGNANVRVIDILDNTTKDSYNFFLLLGVGSLCS